MWPEMLLFMFLIAGWSGKAKMVRYVSVVSSGAE